MQTSGNLCGGCIGIDVVDFTVFTARDGGNDGNIAVCNHIAENLGIYPLNIPDKADVLALAVLDGTNHIAVQTAKPDSAPAVARQKLYQMLVDLARQHHLHHFDGFFIRVAKPADKAAFFADAF